MPGFSLRKNSKELLSNFIISATVSILIVRLFLEITNNFQWSFGQWHIAHVFWGGLIMLLGLLLPLLISSEKVLIYSSYIGGFGWGWFIDEIGKFISHDNNYWFRPAVILIYISFILLYLLYHFSGTHIQKSSHQISLLSSFSKKLLSFKPLFLTLSFYSLYYALDKIIDFFTILSSSSKTAAILSFYEHYNFFSKSDIYMIFLKVGSDLLSSLLIIFGWFFYLSSRRLTGIIFFRLSLMANILIGAVIKFYFEQFSAVFSLFINLALLFLVTNHISGKTRQNLL